MLMIDRISWNLQFSATLAGVAQANQVTMASKISPLAQPQTLSKVPTQSNGTRFVVVALLGLLGLTIAAYSATIFGWFTGDDFVALDWLHHCVQHPELVWKNFVSGLWDVPTNKFYRPLFGLSLATDYAIWQHNLIGFHITNLLLHLTNVLLVFGIGSGILKQSSEGPTRNRMIVPLLAATLFALHPIHSEVVAWTCGRVDSLATVFFLLTVWCYMQWRSGHNHIWLISSCVSTAAALASKELAIVLPATITAYEVCMLPGRRNSNSVLKNQSSPSLRERAQTIIQTSRFIAPFWLILGAYFLVRRLTLGTFVGGYDDGLWISNWNEWFARMHKSTQTFLFPLNEHLFSGHSFLYQWWRANLFAVPLLFAVQLLTDGRFLRPTLFMVSWFTLALIPVYRLLDVQADLQGGRYFYLPLVPVCILASMACAALAHSSKTLRQKLLHGASAIMVASLVVSSFSILWINNSAWSKAGHESNNIRAGFRTLFAEQTTTPLFLIFGMPDNIDGAIVARNSLGGLIDFADVPRIATLDLDNYLSFGLLKDSIGRNSTNANVRLCYWNSRLAKFELVKPTPETQPARSWSEDKLHEILSAPVVIPQSTITKQGPAGLEVTSIKPAEVSLKLKDVSGWATDAIVIHLRDIPESKSLPTRRAYVTFSNSICERRTVDGNADVTDKGQTWTFIMHRDPTWMLGGHAHDIVFSFSPHAHMVIDSLQLLPSSKIMPALDFDDSGILGQLGRLHLKNSDGAKEVSYNIQSIPNATGCILEIGKQGVCFEEHFARPVEQGKVLSKLSSPSLSGQFSLSRSMFPTPGYYWIRAWARDSHGNTVGMSSDHIVVCAE